MRSLERRLEQLERRRAASRGLRHFAFYVASGTYHEAPAVVDYRSGLDGLPSASDGPALSAQQIAELERAGWECDIIELTVSDWVS